MKIRKTMATAFVFLLLLGVILLWTNYEKSRPVNVSSAAPAKAAVAPLPAHQIPPNVVQSMQSALAAREKKLQQLAGANSK